jgi:hypothetical protein
VRDLIHPQVMIERIGMDHDEGKSLARNFVVDFETVGGAVGHRIEKQVSTVPNVPAVPVFLTPRGLAPSQWNNLKRLQQLERLLLSARALLFDLFFYFIELHHVAVLVMHIEEVDLVR